MVIGENQKFASAFIEFLHLSENGQQRKILRLIQYRNCSRCVVKKRIAEEVEVVE